MHSSQWITFPIQSCQVLYSFCANLLHPLIIYRFSHYITYTCNPVASYIFWLYHSWTLWRFFFFCAAIKRDSVSLSMFSFLSYVQVFTLVFHLFVTWNIHTVIFLPSCYFSLDLYLACSISSPSNSLSMFFFCFFFFVMLSSSLHIDASTLFSKQARPLPLSFHDTYSLSMSSLECEGYLLVLSSFYLVFFQMNMIVTTTDVIIILLIASMYYYYYYYYNYKYLLLLILLNISCLHFLIQRFLYFSFLSSFSFLLIFLFPFSHFPNNLLHLCFLFLLFSTTFNIFFSDIFQFFVILWIFNSLLLLKKNIWKKKEWKAGKKEKERKKRKERKGKKEKERKKML